MNDIARDGGFIENIKRGGRKIGSYFSVPANSILVLFGLILLVLNIAPLISLLENVFIVNESETMLIPGSEAGDFTWYHLAQTFVTNESEGLALAKGNFWIPLRNSLLISVLSCAFAILIGGMTAYLVTRTDMPFKKFISAVFIFPYIMPQWTLALFWKNFFISTDCASGYVGEFQALTGIVMPEWFVFGPFPIALMLGLHYAPFAYILIGGVLRNMDSNLEEAATILDIPKYKVFTRVTIPMLKPAILSTILLVFSSAMSSYAVAVTLGNPINYFVLATKMYNLITGAGGVFLGSGSVMSLVLIIFGIMILGINQISTGTRKQYTTVSGKSGQVSLHKLGKVGRWVIGALMCICVIFFCFGPMVSFTLESFLPNPGDYSSGLTPVAWISSEVIRNDVHGIFYEPKAWLALGNSVLIAALCSIFAGTIGLLIGYAVSRKRKSKFASFVNGLAFFPYLMPSISLSLVFFLLATSLKLSASTDLTTGIILCVIVGTIKYIPFASRSSLNAMMQVSGEIEEAAVIQDTKWPKRMLRILFPIQKSAFISGYLLPFISCMRELSLFVFIGPDTITLTRYMFYLQDTGIAATSNAANLILVVVILLVNWGTNLLTGASIDKGIGGGK